MGENAEREKKLFKSGETAVAVLGLLLCGAAWFSPYFALPAVLVLVGYFCIAAKSMETAERCLRAEEAACLAAAAHYDTQSRLQEQSLRENRENLRQVQFALLQKQISAHFAVNIITVIKLLTENGEQEKACEMCDGLAFLLQYANDGDELVDGLDELFVLERYCEIIKVRYRDMFTVSFDIDESVEDLRLPRMLLQPLVENAVMHGFRYIDSGGLVAVRAVTTPEALLITISDNGCGMSAQTLEALEEQLEAAHLRSDTVYGLNHIALNNIQSRVRRSYGERYGLSVRSRLNLGTTVILRLPLLPIAEYA